MNAHRNYTQYLAAHSIRATDTGITEHPDLALGPFRFFSLRGGDGGRYRAAASPQGLVAAGGRGADAWFGLLDAGSPKEVAQRIGWLESDERVDPHRAYPKLRLLLPNEPQGMIAPHHWAAVAAPQVQRGERGRVLTAWFSSDRSAVPVRWRVTAPASGEATVEVLAATAIVAEPDDAVTKARRLLSSGTAAERRWAAELLGDKRARGALQQLMLGLDDADGEVREAAAAALAAIGGVKALGALENAAKGDSDRSRRSVFVEMVARFGDAGVAPLARLVREEKTTDVRLDIVHALARIGSTAAYNVLNERAGNDTDASVRKLAKRYLESR